MASMIYCTSKRARILSTKLCIRVYNISNEVPEAEPFLGLPVCLPGLIEAEAYDVGGLGLGYGDIQPE